MKLRIWLCALVTIPLAAQEGVNLYSLEKEAAMGKQYAAEIRRQNPPADIPVAAAYLQKIGNRLVSQLPDSTFEYRFELVQDGKEPIDIVGGYVFVPVGFFVEAKDEAEFAGMLAHVITHIHLRHGTRQATRGQMVHAGSIPLIYWHGHAQTRGSVPIPVSFLKFQQQYELEADKVGVALAAKAGFDPAGLRRYIDRVQPPDAEMSSIPPREERLRALDEAIASQTAAFEQDDAEFRRVQDAVRVWVPPRREGRPTLRR